MNNESIPSFLGGVFLLGATILILVNQSHENWDSEKRRMEDYGRNVKSAFAIFAPEKGNKREYDNFSAVRREMVDELMGASFGSSAVRWTPSNDHDTQRETSAKEYSIPPGVVLRNGEPMTYVINNSNRNFLGHEVHRATKCGGHLASIIREDEESIVDELVRTYFPKGSSVWLGGVSSDGSTNGWSWKDGSPWEESVSRWADGDPVTIANAENAATVRQPDGKWRTEKQGSTSFKVPGIYLLPLDYDSREKYPTCDSSRFLLPNQGNTPSLSIAPSISPTASPTPYGSVLRNGKVMTFVINNSNRNFLGHEVHRATKCGGNLASILNVDEENLVKELVHAYFPNGKYVWLGGIAGDGSSEDWSWEDGSPWDISLAKWAYGEPVSISNADNLATVRQPDGKWRTEKKGSTSFKVPGIYILPLDYNNEKKFPNCDSSHFLLPKQQMTPSPTISPTVSPTPFPTPYGTVLRDAGAMTFVINNSNRNFLGHELHRATKCGGHLASILNAEEETLVAELVRAYFPNGSSTWLGGVSGNGGSSYWSWKDGSLWTISAAQWVNGRQPVASNVDNIATVRQPDGKWRTEKQGSTYFKVPGVYLLPLDYNDKDKYPNCDSSLFLAPKQEGSTTGPNFKHSLSPTASPTVTVSPTSSPTSYGTVLRDAGAMTFVINDSNRNFLGHEVHRATKCGGHLASILNSEEETLVAELVRAYFPNGNFMWLGGVSGNGGPSDWTWKDGSLWDVSTTQWVNGRLPAASNVDNIATVRQPDGKWRTEKQGSTYFKVPGVYLLPLDYNDKDKYPNCDSSLFLTPKQEGSTTGPIFKHSLSPTASPAITVSPTSSPTPYGTVLRDAVAMTFVINDSNRNFLGHEVHRATKCGGHLASILNFEEETLVEELVRAYFPNGNFMWLGGVSGNGGTSDWTWKDGSPWDVSTTQWMNGRPPAASNVDNIAAVRRPDGKWRTEKQGSTYFKVPGVYLLPLDYDDKGKYPNCDSSLFLTRRQEGTTASPIFQHTLSPTASPTIFPSKTPTMIPTKTPTMSPSQLPTDSPTKSPTLIPTDVPTAIPSKNPTDSPTDSPTNFPTPSDSPTVTPTSIPTNNPTVSPSRNPSGAPTATPSGSPTLAPKTPQEDSYPLHEGGVLRYGEPMIYVINKSNRNWLGHEVHRARKCGGHLASILTPAEESMVQQLVDTHLKWGRGMVWLGGISSDSSGTSWSWSDGSPWTISSSKWQMRGANRGTKATAKLGIVRKKNGQWLVKKHGSIGFKVPGLYLLPIDYDDKYKYPYCDSSQFLF